MKKYLQKAWADATDGIDMTNVVSAIHEMMRMDDEHGAIWVGLDEQEYVLETERSLKVYLVTQGRQFSYQAQSIEEVLTYYKLLLDEEFETLTRVFTKQI